MNRSSSAVELAKSNVMSGSEAGRRALADHGYAAPSPQAARRRHASLPADATASTWVPPVVPVCGGPPAKRRRRDTMTSQLAESDVSNGDSFHTPNSAAYYTPPDARSLASADAPLEPFQSQMAASTQGQTGAGNSQVAFSRGHTQRAFRHALLVERYTPNEHIASLAEFLDGLRESLGASLRDLIAEHHGLKMWLGVDVQYRNMFEERIDVGDVRTHTAVMHNDFQIEQVVERLGQEVQFRKANIPPNASTFVLDNIQSLSCISLEMPQPKQAPSSICLNSSPSSFVLST